MRLNRILKRLIVYSLAKLKLIDIAVYLQTTKRKLKTKLGFAHVNFPFEITPPEMAVLKSSHFKFSFLDSSNTILTAIVNLHRPDEFAETVLADINSQSAIDQTEVIVVLSKSNDELTSSIRASLSSVKNLKIFTAENKTVYGAWNKAIVNSNSPIITNVNDDDRRLSHSFAEQIDFMLQNPGIDVGFTDFLVMFDHAEFVPGSLELPRATVGSFSLESTLLEGANPVHAFPVWRRGNHASAGLFDASMKSSGDIDFWVRCSLSGLTIEKFKSPAPQNIYYWNQQGVSSSPNSPGTEEWGIIMKRYRSYLNLGSVFRDL